MKGLFVTGTDTGVGKTAVAAALLCALRRAGYDAVPMKPVQTGCWYGRNGLIAPDLMRMLGAAGLDPSRAELRRMCPYRYQPACSPHWAASRARHPIRLSVIYHAFRELASRHDMILVEGAGGILVPLDSRRTMLDLVCGLNLPVVVAARPGLGTLNHTLLTLRELRRHRLHVLGVVLVSTHRGPWNALERNNLQTISRIGHVSVHRMSWTGPRRRAALPPAVVEEAETWLKAWRIGKYAR